MEKSDPFGWVGQVIDAKYRVDEVVDEGPSGVVYRAHHRGFNEPVAIKCLKMPPRLGAQEREAHCQHFLDEGRLLHLLSRASAGIVQALDVGVELAPGGGWVPYLVLEWLEGVSLADDLERRARDGEGGRGLAEAMTLLEPAARALAAAHDQRVAHCDVKPSNLFLTQFAGRPTLKVLDFGIARLLAERHALEPDPDRAPDATMAFSAPYAAPEQFLRGMGDISPRTDVYALALVLVEVASGRRALKGDDLAELLRASADPLRRPTLHSRGVSCPAEVDDVVRRALAVEPAARFATAFDFWQALTEAVRAPALPPAAGGRPPKKGPPAQPAPRDVPAASDRRPPFGNGPGPLVSKPPRPVAPPPPAGPARPSGRGVTAFLSLVALATGVAFAVALALSQPPPRLAPEMTAPAPAHGPRDARFPTPRPAPVQAEPPTKAPARAAPGP
ncbi:MAG TPA: hypothetical protein VFS43_04160 [Polyangiaceae bacterium]|nr:hypothetical protein [Polyangiaceae bacterium]